MGMWMRLPITKQAILGYECSTGESFAEGDDGKKKKKRRRRKKLTIPTCGSIFLSRMASKGKPWNSTIL